MAAYYGDINADGAVDMGDVIFAERIILGLDVPTADQKKRADVNGDGVVDMGDVILIERYIAGLITKFPVEDMQPPPTGTSWTPLIIIGGLGLAMVALSRKLRKPRKGRR